MGSARNRWRGALCYPPKSPMNNSGRGVQLVLAGFCVGVVFMIILSAFIAKIDYPKEIADITSCNYGDSNFLSRLGFSDMKSCQELHLAIHKKALDICDEEIGSTASLSDGAYKDILNQCVYHYLSFEISTRVSREWSIYTK